MRIGFERGVPVSVDGERLELVELLDRVAEIGCRHGVGIVDHIEDRIVGLKVRDIYEVPAAAIILLAHQDLEKLVGTIHQNQFKPGLERQWAYLVYAGLWWEPLRADLDAFMDRVNEQVTGEIGVKLFKGSARVVTRSRRTRLRPVAGVVRGVRRALLPAGVAGLHRAVVAAVAHGPPAARPQRRRLNVGGEPAQTAFARGGRVASNTCVTRSSASSCGRAHAGTPVAASPVSCPLAASPPPPSWRARSASQR